MGFNRVAVIGADCISLSIALGLKAQGVAATVIGYEADSVAAGAARTKGAFDRVERRLDRTVQDADLVIVSVPLYAGREVFDEIAPHLQPGCFVTDTMHLKAPVMRWAEGCLPEGTQFVGGHPIPNPVAVGLHALDDLDEARADLLKGALYCLTPPVGSSDGTIATAVDLANALEAQPFFIDVTEHDGLQAGVEGLPNLLSIAFLLAIVDTPGWREMRKFAAARFASATELAADAYEHYTTVFLNRENVLLRLNSLLSELIRLRDMLADGDGDTLEAVFATAVDGRAAWIAGRETGIWNREGAVDVSQIPTSGDRVGRIFFGERLLNRLKEGPGHSRRE